MNSLNPVYRVRDQIVDGIKHHTPRGEMPSKGVVSERVVELLNSVGLDASVADMYPHELSGGMKQRVALAVATSLPPQDDISRRAHQRFGCRRPTPDHAYP